MANYNSLSTAELAFRTMKLIPLQIHLIRSRANNRVTTHVFLCTQACNVEYHLRRKLTPMLFALPVEKLAQHKSEEVPAELLVQAKRSPNFAGANGRFFWTMSFGFVPIISSS